MDKGDPETWANPLYSERVMIFWKIQGASDLIQKQCYLFFPTDSLENLVSP